jgi:hypothetical protein
LARDREIEDRRREQERSEERRKREAERRRAQQAVDNRLSAEESAALDEAETRDRGTPASELFARENSVLLSAFELSWGQRGRLVALSEIAEKTSLTCAQAQWSLGALQDAGLVQVTGVVDRTLWSDKNVELTDRGLARVRENHQRTEGIRSMSIEFNAPVTAGIIGNDAKVRRLKVTSRTEGGEGFRALLEAVRSVQSQVDEPAQAQALGDELAVLEGDGPDEEKTAAVQRLVGMARLLGSVGNPILDAANSLKDLLS